MIVSSVARAWDASSEAGLPLRMAQRAFAVVMDDGNRGEFVTAQLRSMARRTLSALSADEQSSLLRWLSLQLATSSVHRCAGAGTSLTRVDAMLAAGVAAALPRTRDELLTPVRESVTAA